jgi:hypothetical protein
VISALTHVSAPGALSTLSWPPSASAVGESAQARAALGAGTADAVVHQAGYSAIAQAFRDVPYRQRWRIFRRSLRFSRVPGADVDFVLIVNPLRRVD